jgi:Predicted membrane protein (DUF2339)
MSDSSKLSTNFSDLLKKTAFLENRIARLEKVLELKPLEMAEAIPAEQDSIAPSPKVGLEFQIGQFWFAKIGVILLLLGTIFILSLPYQDLPPFLPGTIGLFIAGVIALLALFIKKHSQFISQYVFGSALVLLYFSTLRFHYFASDPVLSNKNILIPLLIFVVFLNLFWALKKNSVYLFAINILLGYITAIISESTISLLIINSILTIVIVYTRLKYQWKNIIFFGMFLTYFTHFNWFINNPLIGQKFEFVKGSEFNLIFILFYMLIFAIGNFLRHKKETEDDYLIISTVLNCSLGYGLFLLIFFVGANISMPFYQVASALLFLIISSAFWIKEKSKYSSFFYSNLGFTALSVAIILSFNYPDYFILLCWQSLLVVALALLYRSKIIVIANFFIFVLIFLSYLFSVEKTGIISINFGVVALLTARIMGWQKDRLEIKTELLRNAYLVISFIVFPYALYHLVPEGYMAISWGGLALFYYFISAILNNKKYRWMALYTLLLTTVYLLLIGITQPDTSIRILSFISLGLVLIVISYLYSRSKPKQEDSPKKT